MICRRRWSPTFRPRRTRRPSVVDSIDMSRSRSTPQRTCAACRTERDQSALIRLVVDPNGSVHVDVRAKLPGRGAYVCPQRSCVELLSERSAVLQRAFRQQVDVSDLAARVDQAAARRVIDALSLVARAGGVVGGAAQLERLAQRENLAALVFASDAAERAKRNAARLFLDTPCFTSSLDAEGLGVAVGKGPRAVIGIRHSALSTTLLEELARAQALG